MYNQTDDNNTVDAHRHSGHKLTSADSSTSDA